MATKKRIQSLAAVVLAVLTLLSISPIAAFAATTTTRPATTTTVPTATVYCYKHPSCQGRHPVNNCPGPQRLTRSTSKVTVNNVQHTVVATKPTTISATTVTVTAPNRNTYTYTVSADGKTMTEKVNGTTTRTAQVSDYVNTNAAARTTKTKKDGSFSYQKLDKTETKMNIWTNSGAKTPITRTKANTDSYFAYQAAIENNIAYDKQVINWGIGLTASGIAIAVSAFATAGLSGAAAAAIGAKIAAATIGVGSVAGGVAGSGLVNALEKRTTTYQDAKKYYYILKG